MHRRALETNSNIKAPYERLFEEIYKNHFNKVRFFAYSYLNDNEKAENIAQDVFLALWGDMEAKLDELFKQ